MHLKNILQNALGVGSTIKNKMTTLNKLQRGFKRASNDEQQRMITTLEKYVDDGFRERVMGRALRQWIGEGLAGKLGALAQTIGLAAFVNPAFLTPLIITSPKIIFHMFKTLGLGRRQMAKIQNGVIDNMKKTGIGDDVIEATQRLFMRKIGTLVGEGEE
jgi:hypothetical protein